MSPACAAGRSSEMPMTEKKILAMLKEIEDGSHKKTFDALIYFIDRTRQESAENYDLRGKIRDLEIKLNVRTKKASKR